MTGVPFIKMHGLGNDFVIVDARATPFAVDNGTVQAIADRRRGVGCDQLIIIESSARADAFMRIHNADGGEVAACGNGARCVAQLLMAERAADEVVIETRAGLLQARGAADGLITVDMGEARTAWDEIPLAREMDTLHIAPQGERAGAAGLSDAVGVNMGNPHAVFFVDDVDAIDLAAAGPSLEHDPLFPDRANIGIAQLAAPERIRLRVWERGVGLTTACGSAACAALVAAHRRGLAGRTAEVMLDGGPLGIAWREDNHVLMTGPVMTSFTGALAEGLIRGAAS